MLNKKSESRKKIRGCIFPFIHPLQKKIFFSVPPVYGTYKLRRQEKRVKLWIFRWSNKKCFLSSFFLGGWKSHFIKYLTFGTNAHILSSHLIFTGKKEASYIFICYPCVFVLLQREKWPEKMCNILLALYVRGGRETSFRRELTEEMEILKINSSTIAFA